MPPFALLFAGAALGLGGLFVGKQQNKPKSVVPMVSSPYGGVTPVAPVAGSAYPMTAPVAYSDPNSLSPYGTSSPMVYASAPIAGTGIPGTTSNPARDAHHLMRGTGVAVPGPPNTQGAYVPPGGFGGAVQTSQGVMPLPPANPPGFVAGPPTTDISSANPGGSGFTESMGLPDNYAPPAGYTGPPMGNIGSSVQVAPNVYQFSGPYGSGQLDYNTYPGGDPYLNSLGSYTFANPVTGAPGGYIGQ